MIIKEPIISNFRRAPTTTTTNFDLGPTLFDSFLHISIVEKKYFLFFVLFRGGEQLRKQERDSEREYVRL